MNEALNTYADLLREQINEVEAILRKPTKAGAKRVRKNSLLLAAQGKDLRKTTVQEIG